jgi:hypothetical protein
VLVPPRTEVRHKAEEDVTAVPVAVEPDFLPSAAKCRLDGAIDVEMPLAKAILPHACRKILWHISTITLADVKSHVYSRIHLFFRNCPAGVA